MRVAVLAFFALLAQVAPSCSVNLQPGGGVPPSGIVLSPTTTTINSIGSQSQFSVAENGYTGLFTLDGSNCSSYASSQWAGGSRGSGPQSNVLVTSSAVGNCVIRVSDSNGNSATEEVQVTSPATPTPSPAPGPLTFTPSTLTFAGPSSPTQTVSMTDPNNTGPVQTANQSNACVISGTTIWAINEDFAGSSATRTMTPKAPGTCTLTYSDGTNNSTITATVGSATPTPSPSPSPTPSPTAAPTGAISQVYLEWGDAPANFNQTCLPHCSQLLPINANTGYIVHPSSFLLVQFVSKPTSMTYEITDLDNANYDTGVCNTSGSCTGGAYIGNYGGVNYYGLQVSAYGTGPGWALQTLNKIPCHRYMLYITSPQVATYGPFQTPPIADAQNGNPTPAPCGSAPSATPVPVPTPAISSSFTLNQWTSPGTMETPAPCNVNWTAEQNASCHFGALAHNTQNSVGDYTGCSKTPSGGTCTLTGGALQNIAYYSGVGLGHVRLAFDTPSWWGNSSGAQNPQYYGAGNCDGTTTCVTNAFDAITTALRAAGVNVEIDCLTYASPAGMGNYGGGLPLYSAYWYGHFCGQIAQHMSTTFSNDDLYSTSNEPNTYGKNVPVQMALTSNISAGATSITVGPLSAAPWHYSGIVLGAATLSCNGSPQLVFGDDHLDVGSTYQPDTVPCTAVTDNGNGTYTFTLSKGTTDSHSAGAIVACCIKGAGGTQITDNSGSSYAAYALAAYAQIHANDANAVVVGPNLNLSGADFLNKLMQYGCKTGTCWDILGGHTSPNYDADAPHSTGAAGQDFFIRDNDLPTLAANGDTAHPLLGSTEYRRLPGFPKVPGASWQNYSVEYQAYEEAVMMNAYMSDTNEANYVGKPQYTIFDRTDIGANGGLPTDYPGGGAIKGGGVCSPFTGNNETIQPNNGNINAFDGLVYQGFLPSCVATPPPTAPSGWVGSGSCTQQAPVAIGFNQSTCWLQAPKPGWADSRLMFCTYASPPSCTGTAYTLIYPAEKQLAYSAMLSYEKAGMWDEASRLSGMLLRSSGLALNP